MWNFHILVGSIFHKIHILLQGHQIHAGISSSKFLLYNYDFIFFLKPSPTVFNILIEPLNVQP